MTAPNQPALQGEWYYSWTDVSSVHRLSRSAFEGSPHTTYCPGYCAEERRNSCVRFVGLLTDIAAGGVVQEGSDDAFSPIHLLKSGTCKGNVYYLPVLTK